MNEHLHNGAPIRKMPDWNEVEAFLTVAEQQPVEDRKTRKLERIAGSITTYEYVVAMPEVGEELQTGYRISVHREDGVRSVAIDPELGERLINFKPLDGPLEPLFSEKTAGKYAANNGSKSKPAAVAASVAKTSGSAPIETNNANVFAPPKAEDLLIKGTKSDKTKRVYFFRDGGGFMSEVEVAEIGRKVSAKPAAATTTPAPVPSPTENPKTYLTAKDIDKRSAAHTMSVLVGKWAEADYNQDAAASAKAQDAVQAYLIDAQKRGIISNDEVSGLIEDLHNRKNEEVARAQLLQAFADKLAARALPETVATVPVQPAQPAVEADSLKLTPEQRAQLQAVSQQQPASSLALTPEQRAALRAADSLELTDKQRAALQVAEASALFAEQGIIRRAGETDAQAEPAQVKDLSLYRRLRNAPTRAFIAAPGTVTHLFERTREMSPRKKKMLAVGVKAVAATVVGLFAFRYGFTPRFRGHIDASIADNAMPRGGTPRPPVLGQITENFANGTGQGGTPRPPVLGQFTENAPVTLPPRPTGLNMPETVVVAPASSPNASVATQNTISIPQTVVVEAPATAPNTPTVETTSVHMPQSVVVEAPAPSPMVPNTAQVAAEQAQAPIVDLSGYEYPSNWASMDQIRKYAEMAQADGHRVEWFNLGDGTDLNDWLKIDGSSETADILRVLSQYA